MLFGAIFIFVTYSLTVSHAVWPTKTAGIVEAQPVFGRNLPNDESLRDRQL
jgi:hypothetical protein